MLVQIPEMNWPPFAGGSVGYNGTPAGSRLNATGMRIGTIFNVPLSMNGQSIQKIGWRTATVTTSEAIRIGLYTTSSGVPTSTTYGGSTYVTRASVASNTFYEETLATPAPIAAGDEVALIWEPDAFVAMSLYVGTATSGGQSYPGGVVFTPSTWSSSTNNYAMYLKTVAGLYLPISSFPPVYTGVSIITNATATTENGNVMVVPFGCRVVGIWTDNGAQNVSANFSLNLYAGIGGPLLASQAILGGTQKWASGGGPAAIQLVYFSAPAYLTAGQQVTVTVRPTTSNNNQLTYWTLNAAGEETAYRHPKGGTWMAKISGVWTPNPTQLGRIGLIIDMIDDGKSIRGRRGA